jgi:hypothetical protein
MANDPEWRWYTLAGLLMVVQTLFDFAPAGPWNAPSFTRGLVGLVGLCCMYLGWFRFTFRSKGIIPSINRWQTPKESLLNSIYVGLVVSGPLNEAEEE